MTGHAPTPPRHVPVLCREAVAGLGIRAGGCYVDGTFGGGGYTVAMLQHRDCRVFAIDRDPDAIRRGVPLRDSFRDRLTLMQGRFGDMDRLVRACGLVQVDGVVLDLGVSSPQLDDPARGFSFRLDGPLDMRMEQTGPDAVELVNEASEADLADIIYRYGEERHSRRVARAIVRARSEAAIRTTARLADVVRRAMPQPRRPGGIDLATRTFQALRIQINDELGELDRGLDAAERLLGPGGRLAVVAFHSLEDRHVKTFLQHRRGLAGNRSRHALPVSPERRAPSFTAVTGRPTRPAPSEIAGNPRARSARLRIAERTDAPAWTREDRG